MRRATIDQVRPGMKLARTLYYQYGTVMLAAGTELTDKGIARLKDFGYASIYVYDKDTEDVVVYDFLDEEDRTRVTTHVRKLFDDMQRETSRMVDPEELKSSTSEQIRGKLASPAIMRVLKQNNLAKTFLQDVDAIIQNILNKKDVVACVGAMKSVNSYLYDHSIEVAIRSVLMAKRLGFAQTELREIAMGCLLHDIGYMFLPEDLMKRRGSLSPEEDDILKQHSIFGFYLLRESPDVSLLSAHIAYQHHERQDGQGYPRQLRGTNRIPTRTEAIHEGSQAMHRYASLVAVPNHYDYLVSDLPGKPGLPPDEAIYRIRKLAGTALNQEAVEVFLSVTPVFPIGTAVQVTGGPYKGWQGVVTNVTPGALDQPKVRLLHDGKKRLEKPVNVDLRVESHPIKAVLN